MGTPKAMDVSGSPAGGGGGGIETAEPEGPSRATWGGKIEFLLTLIGCAVGLGNVWRYPFLCYKNGGGAFIIPFVICLVVIGLPMVFMELAVGQFSSLGPITMWKMNPSMKGLGYSMVMVSLIICLYYNVIISYCIFYLFKSMAATVPWQNCGNPWNTPACVTIETLRNRSHAGNSTETFFDGISNATTLAYENISSARVSTYGSFEDATTLTSWMNISPNITSNITTAVEMILNVSTASPTEEFFYREVLRKSDGMGSPGSVRWELVGCLALSWALVALVLCMGIKSIGKVVWFTTLFPYALLTVLVIRTAMLEGSLDGIKYYLTPQWNKLADFTVWSDAATQIFYSLGLCTGCLIAMASYNKFDHNILRDALAVPIINVLTCIYAGFITFAVLGNMAHAKNTTIDKVAEGGPGLAFIVYAEALATMPLPPLWSILFFTMMCILGFSSQISLVEGVLTAFLDEFPILKATKKRELVYRIGFCCFGCLLGVPMLTEGGLYLLNLVDHSVSAYPLLLVGAAEVVVIIYVYSYRSFAYDTRLMLGSKPSIYFMVTLKVVTPAALLVTIILTIYQHQPLTLGTYVYEPWANAIGWLIVLFILLFVPVFMIKEYRRNGGFEALWASNRPHSEWGPALAIHRIGTDYDLQQRAIAVGSVAQAKAERSAAEGTQGSSLSRATGNLAKEAQTKPEVSHKPGGVDNNAYGSSGFGSSGSNLISMSPEDMSVI